MPLFAAVGRSGRPAARRRARQRGRLALLAVFRSQPVPLRSASGRTGIAPPSISPACSVVVFAEFLRIEVARVFGNKGVLQPGTALERSVGLHGVCKLPVYAAVDYSADEDLEQHAEREKAGGAAASFERSAPGGADQPDQSAFPVQYAQLGFLADPHKPGAGAQRGLQIVEHSAPAASQDRKPVAAARRAFLHRQLHGDRAGALRRQAALREGDRSWRREPAGSHRCCCSR